MEDQEKSQNDEISIFEEFAVICWKWFILPVLIAAFIATPLLKHAGMIH